ncbi:MAG: hypothetical protein NW223_10615 [Hyphomicrobiaceae bacterium]|nr:hypothetical protein [Hyphomicrobiaceae bacterium]
MTRSLRILDTGPGAARWNTALSAALLKVHALGGGADVLRFYRFPRCVLLGASQDAVDVVDLAWCAREGVEMARRVTGGGAVYMAPSMLAWDFVTPSAAPLPALGEAIGTAMAKALRQCGVPAGFAAPSSLLVRGRKVSGAATTTHGRSLLHQGTLLLRDETADMARALRIAPDALRSAVTSLDEAGADPVPPEALQGAVAGALARTFGLAAAASALTDQESEIAGQELAAEIGSDSFVRGEDWRLGAGAVA